MAKKKKTFDELMERMEEIVDLLEEGKLPLEDSVKLYQEGVALSLECKGLLETAEQQVTVLRRSLEGALEEDPFGDPREMEES